MKSKTLEPLVNGRSVSRRAEAQGTVAFFTGILLNIQQVLFPGTQGILINPKNLVPCQTEKKIEYVFFSPLVMDNCHFWSNHSELMSCKLRNLLLSVAIQL